MSHYDLYAALGLDRNSGTPALAATLDHLISEASTSGDARLAELHDARSVLGDPDRRVLYDRQLDNPAAPDITVEAVRQLASMPVAGPATSPGETAAIQVDYGQQPVPPQETDGTQRSSRLMPAVAAATVLAVAAVLVTWMITSGGGDEDTAEPERDNTLTTTTVEEATDTSTPTVESTPTALPPEPVTTPPGTPAAEAPPSPLGIESGHYGYGLQATGKCNPDRTDASYTLIGEGTAKCNFANNVGDALAGTSVREGSSRNLSVFSPTLKRDVSLSCVKAQDADRYFLWKCSVDSSGSIVYVYP